MRAVLGMHRDAFAARHISDDAFAANRIAALGAIYQQIVDALYLDHQVAGIAGRTRRRWPRLRGSRFGRLHRLTDRVRRQVLQHLPRGKLAVPERGVQILRLAATVLAGHALQIGTGDPRELHSQTPRLALQILLPDLDGLGVLGGVDDVLNLVARPGRLHQAEPVFTRHVAGLGQNLHHVAVLERRTSTARCGRSPWRLRRCCRRRYGWRRRSRWASPRAAAQSLCPWA